MMEYVSEYINYVIVAIIVIIIAGVIWRKRENFKPTRERTDPQNMSIVPDVQDLMKFQQKKIIELSNGTSSVY